jgi:hypothetical protein
MFSNEGKIVSQPIVHDVWVYRRGILEYPMRRGRRFSGPNVSGGIPLLNCHECLSLTDSDKFRRVLERLSGKV